VYVLLPHIVANSDVAVATPTASMIASRCADNTDISDMATGELGDATTNDAEVAIERLQLFRLCICQLIKRFWNGQ
jgi:hypothetical protein